MIRAIERGLALSDFNEMTPGMIIGYVVAFNNERLEDDERNDAVIEANQADFDRF